jgi:hypothetical protein
LLALSELLFEYLTGSLGREPEMAAAAMWRDYLRGGRTDGPDFLRPFVPDELRAPHRRGQRRPGSIPARQARHLG